MSIEKQNLWTTEDARHGLCQLEDVGESRPPTPDPVKYTFEDMHAGRCSFEEVGTPVSVYRLAFERAPWRAPSGCGPMVVTYRGPNASGSVYYVTLACMTVDGKWKAVDIPMSECNDNGAKLRARLLKNGVNVPVEVHLRKFLLQFVLTSPVVEIGASK